MTKNEGARKMINNIVTLKETTYQRPVGVYALVKKCVRCKGKHIHSASEGSRVSHCINLPSTNYNLVIDRGDVENLRLAEKYGIQLEPVEKDNK